MNKDEDSALRRAKRAVIWNILYYAAILFSTFYLVKKDVLLNWDVTLVFLPLFFVACSSETLSLKRNRILQRAKNLIILRSLTFMGIAG